MWARLHNFTDAFCFLENAKFSDIRENVILFSQVCNSVNVRSYGIDFRLNLWSDNRGLMGVTLAERVKEVQWNKVNQSRCDLIQFGLFS